MPYVAIINTPGYLPDSDQPPPVFDTPAQAWDYLQSELEERYADAEEGAPSDSQRAVEAAIRAAASDVGVVYGPTPGYEGSHDLGLAYCVQLAEEN